MEGQNYSETQCFYRHTGHVITTAVRLNAAYEGWITHFYHIEAGHAQLFLFKVDKNRQDIVWTVVISIANCTDACPFSFTKEKKAMLDVPILCSKNLKSEKANAPQGNEKAIVISQK